MIGIVEAFDENKWSKLKNFIMIRNRNIEMMHKWKDDGKSNENTKLKTEPFDPVSMNNKRINIVWQATTITTTTKKNEKNQTKQL